MKIKKLHKKKVREIANKISILVEIYAKVHNLETYLVSQYCEVKVNYNDDNTQYYKCALHITKIDFKKYMKQSKDSEILNFVKKLESLVSNTELEMLFINKYYPEYENITNIILMLIYDIPRKALDTDLIELNKLYKKYTQNDINKTTKNTNN